MPYVDRDGFGQVIAQYSRQQFDGQEWVDAVLPTPEQLIASSMEEIDARYAEQLKALDEALLNVLWLDGPEEATGRATLQAQRDALLAAKELEILTLFI